MLKRVDSKQRTLSKGQHTTSSRSPTKSDVIRSIAYQSVSHMFSCASTIPKGPHVVFSIFHRKGTVIYSKIFGLEFGNDTWNVIKRDFQNLPGSFSDRHSKTENADGISGANLILSYTHK